MPAVGRLWPSDDDDDDDDDVDDDGDDSAGSGAGARTHLMASPFDFNFQDVLSTNNSQDFPHERDVEQLRRPPRVQQLEQLDSPREPLPRCSHETSQQGAR